MCSEGWQSRVYGALVLAASTPRARFDLWLFGDTYSGDRYFFIPDVILWWITGMALWRQRRTAVRWALGGLLACSVAANAPRFEFHQYRDGQWYAACPAIRAGQTVRVTINPDWTYSYRRRS